MITLVLVGALGAAVQPPAKAGPEKHRAGVVFLPDKGIDAPIFAEVQAFFTQANTFYGEEVLLIGDGPRKALRQRLAKCGADLRCLAKIGRNNKLSEVVLARGQANPAGGVRVVFSAVSVATASVAREITLELASSEAVKVELARTYFEVVGIITPGTVTIENAPETVLVDGTPAPTRNGALALLPGPHIVRIGDEEQKVMVLPGETRALTFASLQPPPPPPPAAASPAVLDAPAKPAQAVSPPAPTGPAPTVAVVDAPSVEEAEQREASPSRWVRWTGLGLAGAGLVLIGVGGVVGTGTTVELRSGTSQAEAQRLNRDARAAARTANTLLGVGAGVMALGAAAWAVDVFVLSREAQVTAALAGGGAWVGVRGRF